MDMILYHVGKLFVDAGALSAITPRNRPKRSKLVTVSAGQRWGYRGLSGYTLSGSSFLPTIMESPGHVVQKTTKLLYVDIYIYVYMYMCKKNICVCVCVFLYSFTNLCVSILINAFSFLVQPRSPHLIWSDSQPACFHQLHLPTCKKKVKEYPNMYIYKYKLQSWLIQEISTKYVQYIYMFII